MEAQEQREQGEAVSEEEASKMEEGEDLENNYIFDSYDDSSDEEV